MGGAGVAGIINELFQMQQPNWHVFYLWNTHPKLNRKTYLKTNVKTNSNARNPVVLTPQKKKKNV